MAEKAWWREQEVAGHIVSTVRRQELEVVVTLYPLSGSRNLRWQVTLYPLPGSRERWI